MKGSGEGWFGEVVWRGGLGREREGRFGRGEREEGGTDTPTHRRIDGLGRLGVAVWWFGRVVWGVCGLERREEEEGRRGVGELIACDLLPRSTRRNHWLDDGQFIGFCCTVFPPDFATRRCWCS